MSSGSLGGQLHLPPGWQVSVRVRALTGVDPSVRQESQILMAAKGAKIFLKG